MFNTLIRISYDGSNYSGFQTQANASTVQEALERALKVIYKQPVRVAGAGRTDSGVHARGQTASFQAPFHIAADNLPHALNALLPADIVVTAAEYMPENFHARFDALGKLYSYTIDRAPYPQVLKRLYSWHLPDPLNLELICQAAQLFTGTHDFKSFQTAGSSIVETTRTLHRVEAVELHADNMLTIYFEGSGFLYRMVRLITGTLIRAGKGSITLPEIQEAIEGSNPAAAGPTVPPHGLCLEKVIYDPEALGF